MMHGSGSDFTRRMHVSRTRKRSCKSSFETRLAGAIFWMGIVLVCACFLWLIVVFVGYNIGLLNK